MTPSYSHEAETGVLAAMLLDNSCIPEVVDRLKPEDFFKPTHRKVFEAICELEIGVDEITVSKASGIPADILIGISQSIPSSANVLSHVDIVFKDAQLRRVRALGQQLARAADFDEAVELAEKELVSICDHRTETDETLQSALHDFMDEVDRRRAGEKVGISIGLGIGEIEGGELVILAGRPSHGKTSFATQVAGKCAVAGISVGIISLEMSKRMLAGRMVAQLAGVSFRYYITGRLDKSQWDSVSEKLGEIQDAKIWIDSTADRIVQIKAKVRMWQRKYGIGLVVIDYLQLMQGSGDNRNNALGDITRGLKKLAVELDIPIVCLSQLNRRCEEENRMPRNSDLRDSGNIENDADKIWFLHRADLVDKGIVQNGLADVKFKIGKNRNGETKTLDLQFAVESMTFQEG